MYTFLQGIVTEKEPTRVVLDVNGVGYELAIPVSTYETLPETGHSVKLLTYLHVREDALQLFGFASSAERSVYLLLISVSGIGPKSAIGIMSGVSVPDFKTAVVQENVELLTAIPGIGKKTAQRIVVELKDKMNRIGEIPETSARMTVSSRTVVSDEALMALMSLGYSRPLAEKAVARALRDDPDRAWSLQELIKVALRSASL